MQMQAVSISNVSPAKVPVPDDASLLSPGPQQSSPFAALFQAKLNTANDATKLPAPGKATDSARAKDATGIALDPLATIPQFVVSLPLPVAPQLPISLNGTGADGAPNNTKSANLLPTATIHQMDMNMTAPNSKLVSQVQGSAGAGEAVVGPSFNTAPIPAVPSGGTSASTSQKQDSAKTVDPVVTPSESQILSSASSNRTSLPLLGAIPQADANVDTFVSKLGGQVANTAPNPQNFSPAPSFQTKVPLAGVTVSAPKNEAIPNLSSGGSAEAQASASPWGADVAPANLQNKISGLPDTANLPLAASPNSSGGTNFHVLQAVNAGLETLNLPAREAATGGNNSPLSQSLQTALTPVTSATPVAPTTKTMAAGLPAINSRDAMHPQAANIVAPAKPPSKDASDGSQGNGSNTKPEHSANSAAGHTEPKGSLQSLEIPGANSGSMHAASTDSTIVAAAMRTPAESHAANVDTKPGSSNVSTSAQGQALPAPGAAEQSVVNAAHLLDHAGQTEIRIEMQGGSLGGVELRAHMSGNDIGASIAVEHHDVQAMLANDLPALHSALIEKNLRVDHLSVSQGMPGSLSGGPGSDAGQRSFYQPHPKATYTAQDERPTAVPDNAAEYSGTTNRTSRLSVLA